MDNDNMELNHNYPKEHLQGLYNMREQDQLCDVTILVGGVKFRAHKTVLAATGHHFLTMFTSGFRESSAQEVTIEGSAAAFEILLNFVYTGGVDLTTIASCISEVMEMACYMQFTDFVDTCSAAVQKLLKAKTEALISLGDVCKVMLLAKTHDLTAVYQATVTYLEDKVESLKRLDVFLENISATFLEDFLCHEYRTSNTDDEKHMLELVINWLKHDWEKSKEHSHQLLQKVRLGLVASEDIKKLIGPEILDIPGCSELVNSALGTVMAPVLWNSDDEVEFHMYDAKLKEWIPMKKMDPLPPIKSEDDIYELIVVKGVLYAAGGTSGREFLKYQASENKWVPLSSKPFGKKQIKLVDFGAYIYAFGACCEYGTGFNWMIERYDISAEKWEVLSKDRNSYGFRIKLIAEVMDSTTNRGNCRCMQNDEDDEDSKNREMSAVAFEGKIFVSSLKHTKYDVELKHEYAVPRPLYRLDGELGIFDPVRNTYEVEDFGGGDKEDDYQQWEGLCFTPTLFIYEDELHRMVTHCHKDHVECYFSDSVERLSVTEEDRQTRVEYSNVKLQLLHDFRDEKKVPFCLQDYIVVKQSGTAGSKAGSKAAGSGKVKSIPQYGKNKQLMCIEGPNLFYPVWFSFEKKLTVPDRK